MKKLVLTILVSGLFATACGGKSNGASTPSNAGGTTEAPKEGAPMGGATYGSAAGSAADPCAAPADPCAAPPH